MKLVYDVNEGPPFRKNLIYAFQQVLAIMAATLLVPVLVNSGSGTAYMSQPAALCGAGFGTLFYLFVTKRMSPVFLGSSFAFISPLIGATAFGYLGIFLGALFAGMVYVVIAAFVRVTMGQTAHSTGRNRTYGCFDWLVFVRQRYQQSAEWTRRV